MSGLENSSPDQAPATPRPEIQYSRPGATPFSNDVALVDFSSAILYHPGGGILCRRLNPAALRV
jgi:hypothetical protein